MYDYKPKSYWESAILEDKKELDLMQSVITNSRLEIIKAKKLRESKLRLEVFYLEKTYKKVKELMLSKMESYKMFLIGYEKELLECEKNFDGTMELAKHYKGEDNSESVKEVLNNYSDLKEDDKNHIEVKNTLYKNLKTLMNPNKK
tara:strand:- start:7631 stop:8068 length:438 start_codon:yes stop_codon:yes gene_type:complete